jgi:hypothetical protein
MQFQSGFLGVFLGALGASAVAFAFGNLIATAPRSRSRKKTGIETKSSDFIFQSAIRNRQWAITSRRAGRSIWAFVAFLALSCILLEVVAKVYLLRVGAEVKGMDERGRKLIAVHALLLMFVVLAVLGLSWVLIFRVGRYFFPRDREPRVETKYTDAWEEAGKRMKTPEE